MEQNVFYFWIEYLFMIIFINNIKNYTDMRQKLISENLTYSYTLNKKILLINRNKYEKSYSFVRVLFVKWNK